jgi:hypothetical protein
VTAEFIASLREEIRQMVRQAIDASPYGFIVAIEHDEDRYQDKDGIEA